MDNAECVMIEDIKDSKYHYYNLSTFRLEPGWYVYVTPSGDDKLVEEVLVARGFVIKRKLNAPNYQSISYENVSVLRYEFNELYELTPLLPLLNSYNSFIS